MKAIRKNRQEGNPVTPGSIDIKHTSVFKKNLQALRDDKIRFILNQGGTRSSKTYSICQLLIVYALTNPMKIVSVCRKSFPSLSASVMRDFIEILQSLELYETVVKHNKTSSTLSFPNGTFIKFFSIDEPFKLRGRRHDICYLNEANELDKEDFIQLNLRTASKLFMDYNPSEIDSWIDDILKDEKATLIHSTYKDNKFLTQEQIREIENLINVDENYYRIYTLGLPPTPRERVFTNIEFGPFPNDIEFVYGLDFGYTDPMAMVQVAIRENVLYIKQLIYETHLDPSQLLEEMKKKGISYLHHIYCDSARPDLIAQINDAGYDAGLSNKAIKEGLDTMRLYKIVIDNNSSDAIREFKNYAYKKVKDRIIDGVPVDYNNHLIDAARYATMGLKSNQGFGISIMI